MTDAAHSEAGATRQAGTPNDQRGVLVFPDLMSTGDGYTRMSLRQAFTERHNTDAMFACYEGFSRRRKKGENDAHGCRYIAVDIDRLKGKETWDDQETLDIIAEVVLDDITKGFGAPVVFYSTRHGLRAMWPLERAATGGEWEATWEMVVGKLNPILRPLKFHCDPAAKDWTRLFRLPLVVRGTRTWEEPMVLVVEKACKAVPVQKATRAPEKPQDRPNPRGRVSVHEESLGQVEDARIEVWGAEHSASPVSRPAAVTLARMPEHLRRILTLEIPIRTTEECVEAGFAGRDTAIVGIAGSVVRFGVLTTDMTPQDCLGLMAPAIYQMEPDLETGTDWGSKARAKIAEYWSRDYTDPELLSKVADDDEDEVLEHYVPFLDVLRQIQVWLRTAGLPHTLKDAWDYYVPRYVTVNGRSQLVIWSGRNSFTVGSASNLLPKLLKTNPPHPMLLWQKDKLMFEGVGRDGRMFSRPRKGGEFETTFQGDPKKLPVAVDNEKFIKNIKLFETDGAFFYERPRFVFAEGLESRYNETIDLFLRNALGDHYPMFVAYMKVLPDITRALPLMIFYGDSQQGKSYIANGICALFGDTYWRYTEEQATDFNGERAYSPMIMIEESFGNRWTSESLREEVNHSQMVRVEPKGRDAMMIKSASRIIKCSNSIEHDLRALLRERRGKSYKMVESSKIRQAVANRVRTIKVLPKNPDLDDPLTVFGTVAGDHYMRSHLLWIVNSARIEGVDPSDYPQTFNLPVQESLEEQIMNMAEVTATVYEGPAMEVMQSLLSKAKNTRYDIHGSASEMGEILKNCLFRMFNDDVEAAIAGDYLLADLELIRRNCDATAVPVTGTVHGLLRAVADLACTQSVIPGSDPGRNRYCIKRKDKRARYRAFSLHAMVGQHMLLADDVDSALEQ